MTSPLLAAEIAARLALSTPTPMPPTREEGKHAFTGPQSVVVEETTTPPPDWTSAIRIILI